MPDFKTLFQRQSALILSAALLLRLGVAIFVPLPDDFMYLSEPGWIAANLTVGKGYVFDFYGTRPEHPLQAFVAPLHPWFMALALKFKNPSLVLGLMQALVGTATVWLLYQLARQMAGRRVGVWVGWGAALYPSHVLGTSQPISAVLHAACLAAVLLSAVYLQQKPSRGRAGLTGLAIGIFALSRPQILIFAPLVVGWLWLNRVRGKVLWQTAGVLVMVAVLVVLPWFVRNALVFERPLVASTNGGVTFWNGNNPFTTGSGHDVYADKLAAYQGVPRDTTLPDVYEYPEPYPFPPEIEAEIQTVPELELDRAFYRAGLAFIREQPVDWLQLELRKLLSFWWFRPNLGANALYRDHWTQLYKIQYAGLLALVLPGIWLSIKSWRRYSVLYGVFAYYTITHLVYHVLTRYRWEIELLMLIFAALALEKVWQALPNRRAAA